MKKYSKTPIFLVSLFFLVISSPALSQDEPVIAPEIGRLIATEGIDAAQARFDELTVSGPVNTGIEIQGMYTLMSEYMQAGKMKEGEAVAQMASQLTQNMMKQSMPGLDEQIKAQEKAEADTRAQEEASQIARKKEKQMTREERLGKSRDDLERFEGLYGKIGEERLGRTMFVAISCDGHLVTGPMWADVSAWWMRSESEMVFTYEDSFTQVRMEFEVDEDNDDVLMKHDLDAIESPLEWKDYLPDEFDNCIEPPIR